MNSLVYLLVIAFFGLFSVTKELGFCFYIAISIFFVFKNRYHFYLLFFISLISMFLFRFPFFVSYSIYNIFLFIYSLLPSFFHKEIITILYAWICHVITYFVYILSFDLLYFFISSLTLLLILFLFVICEKNKCKTNKYFNGIFNYIDLITLVISIIICLYTKNIYIYNNINIIIVEPIGFYLGIFLVMYLSSTRKELISFIFSLIICYLYYDISLYSFIFPLVSIIYSLSKKYSWLVSLSMIGIMHFIYPIYFSKSFLLIILSTIVLFEFIRPFIIIDFKEGTNINEMYKQTFQLINNDVLSFASFLDIIRNETFVPNDNIIKQNIQYVIQEVCFKCSKQEECFKRNKGKIYFYFQNLFRHNYFFDECVEKERIEKLNNLYNISENNIDNDSSFALITKNLANTLKQYSQNYLNNEQLDFNKLIEFKKKLIQYGYKISSLEIENIFLNDFKINIKIHHIEFSKEKECLEMMFYDIFMIMPMFIIEKQNKNIVNIVIVPKRNYDIRYGYGSIAQPGNQVCGDNYLVKEVRQNKMLAIISDGMGKGVEASIESSRTIRMIDHIMQTNMSTDTSLQILNTFYYLQDEDQRYSTLDFLEIDCINGDAFIYKAGATTTFIMHDDGSCERIENDQLPFGLNEMIISKKIKLRENDLIIMASDGVFENSKNELELEEYIRSIRMMDPQKITYEILNYVRYQNIHSDDMSIIALKMVLSR